MNTIKYRLDIPRLSDRLWGTDLSQRYMSLIGSFHNSGYRVETVSPTFNSIPTEISVLPVNGSRMCRISIETIFKDTNLPYK